MRLLGSTQSVKAINGVKPFYIILLEHQSAGGSIWTQYYHKLLYVGVYNKLHDYNWFIPFEYMSSMVSFVCNFL